MISRMRCYAIALVLLCSSFTRSYAQSSFARGAGNSISSIPSPVASFRLVFGLHDTQPTAWDGEVRPAQGQELSVEEDRFRDHQYENKGWSGGIISIKRPDPNLPNDMLRGTNGWVISTRESPLHGPTTEWHDFGQIDDIKVHAALQTIIVQPTIVIHVDCRCLDKPVHIHTVRGDFSFEPLELLRKGTVTFLNGNVSVSPAIAQQAVASERLGEQDFPAILEAKNGVLWVAWQEFDGISDRLVIRQKTTGLWSKATVLAQNADISHAALAEDEHHRIWIIWAMQSRGRWDLYARSMSGASWSITRRLTAGDATKNLYPTMTTDSRGKVWLVWQRTNHDFSQIYAKHLSGSVWSAEEQVSTGPSSKGNNWWPSLAAGPDGTLAVAWDGYASGSYDVYLRRRSGDHWSSEETVASTPAFEAHPSVAIDANRRVWLAWDKSGVNWGKDVGFLSGKIGTPLHNSRSIEVAILDGAKRLTTQTDIQEALGADGFWELPHLQMDTEGRPWLFVRHMVMREPDSPLEDSNNLALWELWASNYDGRSWRAPHYVPHSTGRNDMMPVSALSVNGEITAAWATDGRNTKDYQPQRQEVRIAALPESRSREPLALVPYRNIATPSSPLDPQEKEVVARIRNYRIRMAGKTFSIFRGDLHRHTDISVDGNNDGSLLDAYRYARDAASLDFVGVTNHTDDIWDQYNWWRTQKTADMFNQDGSFIDFYGYERSVEWPNGHRNIFFTKRGAPILPIGAFEARAGYAGSGTLYAYLHRYDGFSIPHTTGRTSGTDWRDNDPVVESVMEIYQGMRDSYEYPASPRPFQIFTLPDNKALVPRASSSPDSPSFKPLGFAWNALNKGYKLGFIASSDHISTHVSYACILAEHLTRESLKDAIRNRRTYAATDNIVLDLHFVGSDGEHMMGSSFKSTKPLRIDGHIVGTGDFLQVDVIRDSAIIATLYPEGSDASIVFTDNVPHHQRESYYYVRLIQKNGHMAWSSPVWVTYP